MSSVAPLGCTTGAATGVPSSLGVELDPVFTFPGVDDAAFFFLERVIVSFDPLRGSGCGRPAVARGRLDVPFVFFHSCLYTTLALHCFVVVAICVSGSLGINVLF